MKEGMSVEDELVVVSRKYVEIVSHLFQSQFACTKTGRERSSVSGVGHSCGYSSL